MFYIVFCYQVFEIWRVLDAYSTSQFGPAMSQVPSLLMWLVATTLDHWVLKSDGGKSDAPRVMRKLAAHRQHMESRTVSWQTHCNQTQRLFFFPLVVLFTVRKVTINHSLILGRSSWEAKLQSAGHLSMDSEPREQGPSGILQGGAY